MIKHSIYIKTAYNCSFYCDSYPRSPLTSWRHLLQRTEGNLAQLYSHSGDVNPATMGGPFIEFQDI